MTKKGNQARIKKVIQLAAGKAGYKDEIDGDRAMGLAASIDTGSPCTQVVEVSVENNEIKVHKVVCAFDCGLAVNPDQVKAQCDHGHERCHARKNDPSGRPIDAYHLRAL